MANTLTIEDMQQTAAEKGGWCLSTEYTNQLTKLTWKCAEGHVWETRPSTIRAGKWCPICARTSKNRYKKYKTIDDMRKLAEDRYGHCLSEHYSGTQSKLMWQCADGHVWEALPNNVQKGSWCPICSKQKKKSSKRLTLEDMVELASQHEGFCLSDTYVNAHTKLEWKCSEDHVWEASPSNIKKGSWCPTCARENFGRYRKYEMKQLHDIAASNGGKCLVEEYDSSLDKIPWECAEGHLFETPPSQIMQGSWCPYCAGRHNHSIDKMHQIAADHGGECLSTTYKNVFTKLKWKCANGHVFEAIPKHVVNGHWCPNCTTYLNEQRCRYILEELFQKEFMKNRTKLDGYELDGYNEELKLAFEYHGKQHYEEVEFFYSRGDMTLDDRINRDLVKEERCQELGIELLVIPYTVRPEEFVSYISEELLKKRFQFQINPEDIDFKHFSPTKQELKEIQEIVEAKDGQCLSSSYINIDSKLDFVCEKGHFFSTTPYRIKKGNWCRKCYEMDKAGASQRLDSGEMHRIAEAKGWECLSTEYKNAKIKLTWKCEKNHIFERSLSHVKEGRGCPTCSKLK